MTIYANVIELTQTAKNDLYSYGIMVGDETGDLRLEDKITRAEFCKMICVCLGFKDKETISHNVTEDFYDVNKNHWAYDYIQVARGLALVEGVGNGYFNPDKKITVQDAVKIIVTALGYKPKAEKEGYPIGYINTAQEIGLINKGFFELENYATRKEVAYLIYNSLDIPLMQITSFGKDIKYTIMDGTDNLPLITLRKNITKTDVDVKSDDENTVPRFNGEEYTGRIVKIADLEKLSL